MNITVTLKDMNKAVNYAAELINKKKSEYIDDEDICELLTGYGMEEFEDPDMEFLRSLGREYNKPHIQCSNDLIEDEKYFSIQCGHYYDNEDYTALENLEDLIGDVKYYAQLKPDEIDLERLNNETNPIVRHTAHTNKNLTTEIINNSYDSDDTMRIFLKMKIETPFSEIAEDEYEVENLFYELQGKHFYSTTDYLRDCANCHNMILDTLEEIFFEEFGEDWADEVDDDLYLRTYTDYYFELR